MENFSAILLTFQDDASTATSSSLGSIGISTTVNQEASTSSMPRLEPIGTFFSWYDYVLFSVMLSLSLGIGIYFGCCGKKQTSKEYLLAGGNMKVMPVIISLVASHCSGLTLLALPSEVYMFGANYCLCVISLIIVAFVTVFVFLPVFYKLQLTSTYEYLGIRFDRKTRKFSSILFTISVFLHIPIVTYIPALAFSSASGLDKNIIIPIICGICIFYTAVGGLKALVWSDTLLFTCTMGALVAILGIGVTKMGGLMNVLRIAYEGDRMVTFDFGIDFTKRDSFWTIVIGFTVYWIAMMSINQGCTQKFLSVPTLRQSKLVVYLYCGVGMVSVKILGTITGLTLYADFAKCDPLTTHKISHNNEILPYYILDVAGKIPGLAGLFIAGVFCASLSSLSANLNSLAGTIYEDFVKTKISEKRQKNPAVFLKSFVVLIGVISTALVYTVEYLGGLLSLSIGLNSIAQGPLLGMFTLGVMCPGANSAGAFYGGLVSVITMAVLVFGANYLNSNHVLKSLHKSVSIEGCFNATNSTIGELFTSSTPSTDIPPFLKIFSISFYWYCLIGAIICIVVALIISYFSKENDPVARELLSPIIYGIIDKDKYVDSMNLEYSGIDEAISRMEGNILGRRVSKWDEMREERMRKMSMISNIDI